MKMRFEINVKDGVNTIGYVCGREIDPAHLTVEQLQEIPELEAKLEKLTGFRFHINQIG